MKNSIVLSLLATAVVFSFSCKKTDPKKDLDQKLAEINRQNQERMSEIDRLLLDISISTTQGGQPGAIVLNGVTIKDADKLDSRITVSQSAGLSKSGSATAVTVKNLLKLNSLEEQQIEERKQGLKKSEDERTYINLGCQLAESEIAGLNDITSKVDMSKDLVLAASRIFICGEQKISNKILLSLSASEIMLKDTIITFQKNLGSLSVSTGTLVLIGKNKILSLGEDGTSLVQAAAEISLFVGSEIYGDGALALESRGGSYLVNVGGL
ncbi:MAG: hypothetical protein V4654_12685 [Bdellovibrionota bacterium]